MLIDADFEGVDALNGNGSASNGSSSCTLRYKQESVVELWLLGVILPPFILLGIFSNIVSITVFGRAEMRCHLVNLYLLALGVFDTLFLLTGLVYACLTAFAELTSLWSLAYLSMTIALESSVLQSIGYYASIWTTVGMYVHRFFGIWFPLKADRYCRGRHVHFYLASVLCLAIVLALPIYLEQKMVICQMEPLNTSLPHYVETELAKNDIYVGINAWITIIVFFVLPFIILIVVNTFVIVAIRRSKRQRARMSTSTPSRRRMDQEIRISTMLVLIVLSFMITNAPNFAYYVLSMMNLYGAMNRIFAYVLFFAMLNPLVNTTIYWCFVPMYREAVNSVLKCGKTTTTISRSLNSTETYRTRLSTTNNNVKGSNNEIRLKCFSVSISPEQQEDDKKIHTPPSSAPF